MIKEKIDFVILWVDGNDEKWLSEKKKYEKELGITKKGCDNRNIRFRDWENLRYWFRGVEKFAPWVNKVHFITCGHIPKWLNANNPKLNIVKHSDYMPKNCLPTFNSNAIELLIHKIDGLADKFVLFNDDLFLTRKVKSSDFFKKGKPCNTMSLSAILPIEGEKHYKTVSNNIEIINKYFDFKHSVKTNLTKYLSIKQKKYILKSYPLLIYNRFMGFSNFHLPLSYLKSTFEEVWNKEEERLNNTVYNKFRSYDNDVSHWLFNYWQFASGNFYQKNVKFGINLNICDKRVHKSIIKQKYKVIGLGDSTDVNDFETLKRSVINDFEQILPQKSDFEI